MIQWQRTCTWTAQREGENRSFSCTNLYKLVQSETSNNQPKLNFSLIMEEIPMLKNMCWESIKRLLAWQATLSTTTSRDLAPECCHIHSMEIVPACLACNGSFWVVQIGTWPHYCYNKLQLYPDPWDTVIHYNIRVIRNQERKQMIAKERIKQGNVRDEESLSRDVSYIWSAISATQQPGRHM